jgi:hypothetical protein
MFLKEQTTSLKVLKIYGRKKSVLSSQADRRFSFYELPEFSESDSVSKIWFGRTDSVSEASIVLSYLTLLSVREDIRKQPTMYMSNSNVFKSSNL